MNDSRNPDDPASQDHDTTHSRPRIGGSWREQLKGRRLIKRRSSRWASALPAADKVERPLERAGRGVRAGRARGKGDDDSDPANPAEGEASTASSDADHGGSDPDGSSSNTDDMARQEHAMRTADERQFDD